MFTGLQRRLRAWWLARLQPAERWTLTQRTIYIVPTRAGLAFVFTLLLLLLASINYQLNLGYALTFLLAGSALASMHMTHSSLRGLSLHLKPVTPCFAGGSVALDVVVTNPGAVRHGLGFAVSEVETPPQMAWAEIAPRGQSLVSVSCPFATRGRHALPLVRVESRFPFGLFKAWSVWRPAGQVWVYPALEVPVADLPRAQALSGGGQAARAAAGGDEFDGVRPWRRGDGPRLIVWKKVARSGEWVSRDMQAHAQRRLWLDWADTRLREPETRLSRLAAWVQAAEQGGQPWGLRLPGVELDQGHGTAHQHQAWQALAEWPGR